MTKVGIIITFALGVLALLDIPWVNTLAFLQLLIPIGVGLLVDLGLLLLISIGAAVGASRR